MVTVSGYSQYGSERFTRPAIPRLGRRGCSLLAPGSWKLPALHGGSNICSIQSMSTMPYAELHSHTNFSFLDGVSHPEDLVYRAADLDYRALAVTDHNGMYGAVRFARAAKEVGLPAVYGVEIGLSRESQVTGRESEEPVASASQHDV